MTRIVKGSLRYKSAPDVDSLINVDLEQKHKDQVEFLRNVDINQAELFDEERQISSIMRPSAKMSLFFENAYTGLTLYTPFKDNLYYKDLETFGALNPPVYYPGFPQYNEFDLIRTDYDVPGYTSPPNEHVLFIKKSATTYNWMYYLTYPFKSDNTKSLKYQRDINLGGGIVTWTSGDGIPFVISNFLFNGVKVISCKCPCIHNLQVGQFVEFTNLTYLGQKVFEVFSLGDGSDESEKYIFNLFNFGDILGVFGDNVEDTFKKVLNTQNSVETRSKYYIRQHKTLTVIEDALLNKSGFEGNPYFIKRQYETSALTPDAQAKITTKTNHQSYTINFSKDIDIAPLLDNQQRPISELYLTILHRGYFGWFYDPTVPLSLPNLGQQLKQGYEFNLQPNTLSTTVLRPNPYWQSPTSNIGLTQNEYTTGGPNIFRYNEFLPLGTILDGDFCEWNDYDQTETVISSIYHKFVFNISNFDTTNITSSLSIPGNPYGYHYKPHHLIRIREYSPYVEVGNLRDVDLVPGYAFFSISSQTFRWRDLYTYGYIDNEGVGVDYPFLNGVHYPFANAIFRVFPEGRGYPDLDNISDPIIDGCE